MLLGEMIQDWRTKRKISRRKLAKQIGVDHVTLSRIENHDSNSISLDNLQKIVAWVFRV